MTLPASIKNVAGHASGLRAPDPSLSPRRAERVGAARHPRIESARHAPPLPSLALADLAHGTEAGQLKQQFETARVHPQIIHD